MIDSDVVPDQMGGVVARTTSGAAHHVEDGHLNTEANAVRAVSAIWAHRFVVVVAIAVFEAGIRTDRSVGFNVMDLLDVTTAETVRHHRATTTQNVVVGIRTTATETATLKIAGGQVAVREARTHLHVLHRGLHVGRHPAHCHHNLNPTDAFLNAFLPRTV